MYTRLITRSEFDAIRRATYLGGHFWARAQRISDLQITIDDQGWTASRSVSVDSFGREEREVLFSLPWSAVDRADIERGNRPNMAGRFLAAGLIGMAAAKQTVFLVIGTAEGDAFFSLPERHPEGIRIKLAPWLAQRGIASPAADSASPSAPGSKASAAVDRLQKPAELRDRGLLDAAELELLESQLLAELK